MLSAIKEKVNRQSVFALDTLRAALRLKAASDCFPDKQTAGTNPVSM